MKVLRRLSLPALLLALGGPGPVLSAAPAGAALDATDWKAVVGDPPPPGSLDAQVEQGILIWLQRTRTRAEVQRATGEGHPSLGCFWQVLKAPLGQGRSLSLKDRPRTVALLDKARRDLLPVVRGLKADFNRPRPDAVIPALEPALPRESGAAYPSSIAAVSTLFARILSQFQPGNREALLERGGQLGTNRTLAGLHWPSDVSAGQRLGQAFATQWINDPENRRLIIEVCGAEWSGR